MTAARLAWCTGTNGRSHTRREGVSCPGWRQGSSIRHAVDLAYASYIAPVTATATAKSGNYRGEAECVFGRAVMDFHKNTDPSWTWIRVNGRRRFGGEEGRTEAR